jgi:hypothetical protein
MSNTVSFRFAALASFVSGLSLIVAQSVSFGATPWIGNYLNIASPLFGMITIIAIYLGHRAETGPFGFIAVIIQMFGMGLIIGYNYTAAAVCTCLGGPGINALMALPSGILFLVSAVIFLAGNVLFGVSVILGRRFSAAAAVLYIIGFAPLLLPFVNNDIIDLVASFLAGIAILWWGVNLWRFNLD